jgi:hypothetical protein
MKARFPVLTHYCNNCNGSKASATVPENFVGVIPAARRCSLCGHPMELQLDIV